MPRLSDEELLRELADRVDEKNRALFDLRRTTRQLEDVNRRLVASEALKSDFLSNIRQEINSPLAAILALAREIAAGVARDAEETRALAGTILSEAFSLDFQLRNVFAAAEIEAGAAIPNPARVDISALVGETVASFTPAAAAKGLELRTAGLDAFGAPPEFRTDPAMLQLVLANLLSNAIKFGGSGGVLVSVRRGPAGLELSVEDRGIGIAAADQEAIFERFRQLDRGSAKSYPGQGLGLSIVRATLELLGGSVAVQSEVGRGSRFTALIPEAAGGGGEDVFADAGNEYFFGA